MKKVMIFGTFDGVHDGHRALFHQAAQHGDRIMVVVARDETVEKVKGKRPQYNEYDRVIELFGIDLLDDVILGHDHEDKCHVVREHKPDVVLLGYDQEHFVEDLYALVDDGDHDFFIVRAEPYKEDVYKSSLLNNC